MSNDNKFKNGKIYTIRNRNDETLIYVGSTVQPLYKRLSQHKITSKNQKYENTLLYKKMNETNINDWYIELFEDCICERKEQLNRREGEVIREIGTLNINIAGRTYGEYIEENKDKRKEYRETNKEKISEQQKIYNEANKDKIKEYFEANKYELSEKAKIYYETNKDKINEYRENNKDKIKEYRKEYDKKRDKDKMKNKNSNYYLKNKDKILVKTKEYKDNNKDKINEKAINYRLKKKLEKEEANITIS